MSKTKVSPFKIIKGINPYQITLMLIIDELKSGGNHETVMNALKDIDQAIIDGFKGKNIELERDFRDLESVNKALEDVDMTIKAGESVKDFFKTKLGEIFPDFELSPEFDKWLDRLEGIAEGGVDILTGQWGAESRKPRLEEEKEALEASIAGHQSNGDMPLAKRAENSGASPTSLQTLSDLEQAFKDLNVVIGKVGGEDGAIETLEKRLESLGDKVENLDEILGRVIEKSIKEAIEKNGLEVSKSKPLPDVPGLIPLMDGETSTKLDIGSGSETFGMKFEEEKKPLDPTLNYLGGFGMTGSESSSPEGGDINGSITQGFAGGRGAGGNRLIAQTQDAVDNLFQVLLPDNLDFLGGEFSDLFRDFAENGKLSFGEIEDFMGGMVNKLVGMMPDGMGQFITPVLGMMGIPGFASGGTLQPGKMALVGERGPELVMPSLPSTIKNGADTRSMFGKSTPVNVTQNIAFTTDVKNTVRAEVYAAAPEIAAAARQAVHNDLRKIRY